MGKPHCPTGYLALKRGCGHAQAVALTCKSPLCPECERARARHVQRRWTATLKTLPQLKLLTLTIQNGPDLAERIGTLDASFRRFMDFRIGRNNRRKIARRVARKVAELVASGSITAEAGAVWEASTARWCKAVERAQKKHGKSFKMRAIMKGLSSLEVTYNADAATWHTHRHLILSMPFTPQIVISELWSMATEGAGNIVDIRKIDDVETGVIEAVKYVTKGWEIPDDKSEELLAALHGKKRTWVIGRIKPSTEPKKCAGCGAEECKCERVAVVSMSDQVEAGGFDVANPTGEPMRLHIFRDEKNRLTWRMDRGEAVLSLYRARYLVKEPQAKATGPPQRQRVFSGPDLTIILPPNDRERREEAEAMKARQLPLVA